MPRSHQKLARPAGEERVLGEELLQGEGPAQPGGEEVKVAVGVKEGARRKAVPWYGVGG